MDLMNEYLTTVTLSSSYCTFGLFYREHNDNFVTISILSHLGYLTCRPTPRQQYQIGDLLNIIFQYLT